MNKKTLLLFLIFMPFFSTAQNLPKKLAKKICNCMETENITDLDNMEPCFESVLINNMGKVCKYYNVESINDLDTEKLGADIAIHLLECKKFLQNMKDSENKVEDDIIPDGDLDCSGLKSGEFYYVHTDKETKTSDTTLVTITNKMFVERMNYGKTYSILDIEWLSDCQFELTFRNSNDPIKNAFSDEGDKYIYDVVSITSNSFILRYEWKKEIYKFELVQIK